MAAAATLAGVLPAAKADGGRTLTTWFTYTATVAPAGAASLDVWLPIPSGSPWQKVSGLTVDAPGGSGGYVITRESAYGNRMVFLHSLPLGVPLRVTVSFTVARGEVSPQTAARVSPGAFSGGTGADSRVAVGGRFRQIALGATRGDLSVRDKEHSLFRHVVSTMQYDYKKASPEYAQGDSAFVCDYKSGNCSDLHSYLISLSRSLGVPAVLEFGFPLTGVPAASPLPADGKIGGYHCWAWFQDPDAGWTPVDAADARRWADAGRPAVAAGLFGGLVPERSAVAVSRGRDIVLAPPQKAGPLNYFIYPYAEADGVPTPAAWSLTYHVLSDDRK